MLLIVSSAGTEVVQQTLHLWWDLFCVLTVHNIIVIKKKLHQLLTLGVSSRSQHSNGPSEAHHRGIHGWMETLGHVWTRQVSLKREKEEVEITECSSFTLLLRGSHERGERLYGLLLLLLPPPTDISQLLTHSHSSTKI